ncbi:MAG: AarF/UbiB family protein [Chloroflexota bacterium]
MSSLLTERNNGRYRRILIFFGGIILHVIWWDLLIRRLPLLGEYVLASRPVRWRRWAGRFRHLAVEMGGVMIKLGQFLSARVDVLPPEITEELQGLQDEVPPVPSWVIFETLHMELGDLSARFTHVDEQPIAAASLGQAHRGQLLPTDEGEPGESVVIKVQRPHIEEIVEVDLAALRVVARWIMRYRPIGRRADVPALLEEFAITLHEELDYGQEIENAARFAAMFADDDGIYAPRIYREHCTDRVIVLEDVEAIKITDVARITAVNIDPAAVANRVLDAYFRQIFRERFFHADPHPGNLFIRPRDDAAWDPETETCPFVLIFIDFGMMGRVPNFVGNNLSKLLVSVTQKDAQKLTEAYRDLGFFLPGADLERITEAQAVLLERIWGRKLLDLARPDPQEVQELGKEFRDILFDFPFQIPQDFIYLGRALGMVSGLVSLLDPDINPWYQIEKFGMELLKEQMTEAPREALREAIRPYLDLPGRIQRLVTAAENGRLQLQTNDKELHRRLERVEKRLVQINWSILAAASVVSATLLFNRKQEKKP